jgi:hypothetical protein
MPVSLVVGNRCWRHGGTRNLKLLTNASMRCSTRYTSLLDAQQACSARPGCGGVVQDSGLRCAHGQRLRFELRKAHTLRESQSTATWLMLRGRASGMDSGGRDDPKWCASLVEREVAVEAGQEKKRAAERAVSATAARERRRRHATNRTLRCADTSSGGTPDWRIARSAEESAKMLARRPTCPRDWLVLWHTRSRVTESPHDGGCCDGGLIYDPCDADDPRLGTGGDPHARSSLARQALEAVRGTRVLVIGDSVSTQWAAALVLDLHGRGLLPGELNPRATPPAWCGAPRGADWILETAAAPPHGASISFASFSVRRMTNATRQAAEAAGGGCPIEGTGFFQGMGARYVATVERVLHDYKPSVIVANMGLHYDTRHRGGVVHNGDYVAGLELLLTTLSRYADGEELEVGSPPVRATGAGAAAAGAGHGASSSLQARHHRRPLLIFRETTPQHFWTRRGDGSYMEQERESNQQWLAEMDVPQYACRETEWNDPEGLSSLSDGPAAMNRLAGTVLQRFPHVRTMPAFRPLAQRHGMHVHPLSRGVGGAPGRDCTHFCYDPLLWDATLVPFYTALVEWAGGAGPLAGPGVAGRGVGMSERRRRGRRAHSAAAARGPRAPSQSQDEVARRH